MEKFSVSQGGTESRCTGREIGASKEPTKSEEGVEL